MKKTKIQIRKDDRCPICREFFVDKNNKVIRDMMQDKHAGVVHAGCFMPYFPEEKIKILFKVLCYSIGDTIATTPILREMKRLYPAANFTVMTLFPDIFKHNPNASMILDLNKPIEQSMVDAHHFQLNAFDSTDRHHFAMHSVEFSSQSALNRSIPREAWQYELNYSDEDRKRALDVALEIGINPVNDSVILVHPHGTEWKTRDWGPAHMQTLVDMLPSGYKIVSVGGKRGEVPAREMKNYVSLNNIFADVYGKMSILETCAFMDLPCMKLMVTPDTGALHIAASRPELPIVGIFTLIRAHLRAPVRNGLFGYKFLGVESVNPCNCTLDARSMTTEMNLTICPKRTFLERTLAAKRLTEEQKAIGIKNTIGFDAKLEDFNPKTLPCYPMPERVLQACLAILRGHQDEHADLYTRS